MYGIDNYSGFLISGIILNITPGSDTIYILARSISQGKRAGYVSVLGISTGCLFHTLLASFGLSILLSRSPWAFNIIKYLGVAYLLYIGAKMFFQKNNVLNNRSLQVASVTISRIYYQGLLTNVLNPKVALFFLSFLPQFINPEVTNGTIPFILLGCTFMLTGTIWCFFLVLVASTMSQTLRENTQIVLIMQKISGLVFVGLGLRIILS